MSLHLGNLSNRISRNELERVFWRFGRCSVQVKDKFGFVVYELTSDAAKALRTLRGKNICGEPVTLSWSNRQPRPLQGNRRIGKIRESQSGRRRAGEDYGDQKSGSAGRQENRIGDKKTDAGGRRFESVDLGNEATSYCKENVEVHKGKKDHVVGDTLHFEGANIEPISLNRESEQVGWPLNDNGMENGLDFERYDPNHADNRRDDEDDLHNSNFSGCSPTLTKSQEKKGIEQTRDTAFEYPDNAKSLQTCYNCGKLGHKKRNCPTEEVTNRKMLSRINRRHADEFYYRGKGEDELKRHKVMSQRRLQTSKSFVPVRNQRSDRKESSYSKHRTVRRDKYSPLAKDTHRSRREEHREGKRRRMERQSPARHQAKRVKGEELSPIHSDYTESRSRSQSKSASRYSSQSRLQFSKSASLSSNTTSHSGSHCSKFEHSKMTLKTRTSPALLSSPVSLGNTLPSSPKEVHVNQKMSLVNSAIHGSEGDERGREGPAGSREFNLYSAEVSGENPSGVQPVQVVDDGDTNKTILDTRDGYHAIIRDSHKGDNSSALGLDQDPFVAGSLSTEDACVTHDHMSLLTNNLHSEVSVRAHSSKSITVEEMNMVLKHYGMVQLEEHLPVEDFFGSARLWPWEIIYYRRLRKGPISVENYARRVSQNKEFGIVDKYIRSSSGWGDLSKDS